jgi:hypothetical protein
MDMQWCGSILCQVCKENFCQNSRLIYMFVFLALQPIIVVFSQPDSGL